MVLSPEKEILVGGGGDPEKPGLHKKLKLPAKNRMLGSLGKGGNGGMEEEKSEASAKKFVRKKGTEKKLGLGEKKGVLGKLKGRSAPPVGISKYFSKEIIGAQGMEEQRRHPQQTVKPGARELIEKDNNERRDDSS